MIARGPRYDTSACFALAGAVGLAAVSALHAAWALGSSWPAPDRKGLAGLVAGTDTMPGPIECCAVSVALAAASAVTAGAGGEHRAARLARIGVATALLARGVCGLTGQTRLLVPWTPSPHFTELDRRVYGPLCVVLAALAAARHTPQFRKNRRLAAQGGRHARRVRRVAGREPL